jgi:hypothetical protein
VDALDRTAFLDAARIGAALALDTEVANRWTDPSACAGMTVGGLACHLASQVDNAVRILGARPSDQEPIALSEHYARAAWVNAGLDDEPNVDIREGSDADAQSGPDALQALLTTRLEELPGVLAAREAHDPVLIPWQGWALTAYDFLVTRMMEMVVHSDDLAASVGVETPVFPDDVVTPVLALLADVAVRRHGQVAVVRTLSRPQRAPRSVSAF